MTRAFIVTVFLALLAAAPLRAALSPAEREQFLLGLYLAWLSEERYEPAPDHKDWERLMDISSRLLEVQASPHVFTVQIVRAPVANAFALPGGFLFVTDRLLELDLSDDELAFLIGHEFSHVQQRHFEVIEREQTKVGLVNVLSTIGTMVLLAKSQAGADADRIRRQGSWDRPGAPPATSPEGVQLPGALVPALASGVFGTLYLLHSQRELELEADTCGAELALASGANLEGGLGMLKKLFYTNFANADYQSWMTHPLAKAREEALREKLKDAGRGERKGAERMADFREQHAMRILDAYDEVERGKVPAAFKGRVDVTRLRSILLERATRFSASDDVRRRTLRAEVDNHLRPDAEKSTFLLADFGKLRAKTEALEQLGAPVDKEADAKVKDLAAKSLAEHQRRMAASEPGYRQYRFMVENFPGHPQAAEWRWQAWLANPDREKKIRQAGEFKAGRSDAVRAELEKMLASEDDVLDLRRLMKALDRPAEPEKLAPLLATCTDMERLAIYQHEFPEDPFLAKVLERRAELAQRRLMTGRLEAGAGHPDKAVEELRDIILYDGGSRREEDARALIYRLNVLKDRK